MSSFVRKGAGSPLTSGFDTRSQQSIPPGCKTSVSGHILASTGISTLDTLLGDGLPVRRLLLVLEDQPRSCSNYANTMLKCFISEGLLSGNQTIIIGENVEKIVEALPGTSSRSDQQVLGKSPGSEEKLSIAWRYKHIKDTDPSLKASTFGHNLDLGKKLDLKTVSTQPILVPDGDLSHVRRIISSNGQLSRIVIRSLASPLFLSSADAAIRYFSELRNLVRSSNTILMATIPAYLQDSQTFELMCSLADCVLDVQSFAGTPKEDPPAFKDYQGFIRMVKPLRLPDSFASALPDTQHLAFKCKQRRFFIEKFHLPPELGDEDPFTGGCSSIAF